jgi:hypothetical protein
MKNIRPDAGWSGRLKAMAKLMKQKIMKCNQARVAPLSKTWATTSVNKRKEYLQSAMTFEEFEWTNNTIASVVSGLTFRARIAAQTVRAKLEKRMTSNSSFSLLVPVFSPLLGEKTYAGQN